MTTLQIMEFKIVLFKPTPMNHYHWNLICFFFIVQIKTKILCNPPRKTSKQTFYF